MFKHLDLKIKRLTIISHLLFQAYYLYYRGHKDKMYNLIGDELFKLGGVYVKFLQGVILQSWMMQRWRSENKLNIFEKIESQPLNVEEIIKSNLGQKRQRLTNIESEPFAVGSFGHVYKAKLDKDKNVIIKILSPEIRETLKFDLRLLKFFWYFHLRSVKFNKSLNVKLIFEDFKNQTIKEIDYVAEAEFAEDQFLTYKNHPLLVIPKTHIDMSTKEIIVQEYIDGIPITQLLRLKDKNPEVDIPAYVKKELKSNLIEQLQVLGFELVWGMFHYNQIMGDPHPGNVILLKNNKIALIDFGIAAASSKDPVAYLRLIKAYHALTRGKLDPQDIFSASLRFFGRDLYLALAKISPFTTNTGQQIDLNKELSKIVCRMFEETFSMEDLKTMTESPKALVMFDRIANKNNRFGFKLKIQDTEMLRTFITWNSLLDLLNLYAKVMKPVYTQVIAKVEQTYPDLKSLNDPVISHNQALYIISNWLERMAVSDPGLFKNLMSKMYLKSNKQSEKNAEVKKDGETKKD